MIESMKASSEPASIRTASLIASSLIACGVKKVAYCSGSRNAPFAYALARLERDGLVEVFTFAEERVAGFWAVGALQGSAEKEGVVAVVTTSGTAVAELHPAIEEAKHLGLPLIIVTADRPFELRGVGANQTTQQLGIYGPSVVAETEIPAIQDPDEPGIARAIIGRVRRLTARASGHGGLPGPVHLNVALRDPLVPALGDNLSGASEEIPSLPQLGPSLNHTAEISWSQVVDPSLRTLLVAGDGPGQHDQSHMRKIAEYADHLGIPILAEPSSGLCDLPSWLPHGPLVAERLSQQLLAGKHEAPEQVIVLGRPTLSREVIELLSLMGTPDTAKIVVSASDQWQDPSGTATAVVPDLLPDEQPLDDGLAESRRIWLQQCRQIAAEMEMIVRERSRGLNHLGVARMIWRHSRETNLWLAASNVVRSFDLGASAPGLQRVYSNRGLAGIDGTTSAALGLAAQTEEPVRVVLGDLSFVYDLAALAARPGGEPDVQILVFDDGGGSIFHSLEHGGSTDAETYQKYFGIRQEVDIVQVAAACGWRARSAESIEELRDAVMAPIRGRSLVRIPLGFPTEQFREVRRAAAES